MRITVPLPTAYRAQDTLSFHARDVEGTAEQVDGSLIRKGVMIEGVPVLLALEIGSHHAYCEVHADGTLSSARLAQVRAALSSMLGLRIDPAPFLAAVSEDELLAELVQRQPGLRVVQSASVFEALSWAIIGQQINLAFAIALRRSFIVQAGRRHSSGIWCYPEALDAARIDPEALLARKFSHSKAGTLLRLAALVASGSLQLDSRIENAAQLEAVSERLLAVKGIGPWTVNYTLLRGFGYPDCSLHGDVAIRSALQRLLGEQAKPDMARTEALLARYAPHRTMAAAHLWASLSAAAPAG